MLANKQQLCILVEFLLLSLILSACQQINTPIAPSATTPETNHRLEAAIFAGGCFWCTESDFDKIPGVVSTTAGYIGGTLPNPTYDQVSSGTTGHVEAVKVDFDTTKTSFSKLLSAYWLTIDPLTSNQQFCDIGSQYRSVIFYLNPEQKAFAETSKELLRASGRFTQPIVTEILSASEFYRAEEYHQDYYIKNPLRYAFYRKQCGRDKRLEELWGVPD